MWLGELEQPVFLGLEWMACWAGLGWRGRDEVLSRGFDLGEGSGDWVGRPGCTGEANSGRAGPAPTGVDAGGKRWS